MRAARRQRGPAGCATPRPRSRCGGALQLLTCLAHVCVHQSGVPACARARAHSPPPTHQTHTHTLTHTQWTTAVGPLLTPAPCDADRREHTHHTPTQPAAQEMHRGRPLVMAEPAPPAAAARGHELLPPQHSPAAQQVPGVLGQPQEQRLTRHSAGAGDVQVVALLPRSWSVAY